MATRVGRGPLAEPASRPDVDLAVDPEVRLLLPDDDVEDPEVSIVVPALDEELTIGEFVEWCKEGLAKAGVRGEILIVDSSSDRTPEIALAGGARVLRTPKRGLGRAYIDAVPFIRGRYVIVGDADCTYDFRELGQFVEKLRDGFEFIMGSRFKGEIEPKAMPPLHRYFGTPLTTIILNVLYKSRYSDIHCGMRGLTVDALRRIDLRSQGWEYASEMILRASHLGLQTTEVPIRFYRDRPGRLSHVKRSGWLTPWKAGWDTLRVLFVHRADFFLFKPGLVLLFAGLVGAAAVAAGPVTLGETQLTLHFHFFSAVLLIMGLSSTYMAVVAKVLYARHAEPPERWLRRFAYNRTVALSLALGAAGIVLDLVFVGNYVAQGFRIEPGDGRISHLAVTGLLLIVVGFMTFTAMLLMHAAARRLRDPGARPAAG